MVVCHARNERQTKKKYVPPRTTKHAAPRRERHEHKMRLREPRSVGRRPDVEPASSPTNYVVRNIRKYRCEISSEVRPSYTRSTPTAATTDVACYYYRLRRRRLSFFAPKLF